MKYQFIYQCESTFKPEVDLHFFKLRVIPQENACQHVLESTLKVLPETSLIVATDAFGNPLQYGGYSENHAHFQVQCQGVVDCCFYAIPEENPSDVYLYAGPLTTWNAEVRQWAGQALEQYPGARIASVLMHAVHERLAYGRYHTDNQTAALDVFSLCTGVCQDYAHLMIAACRSLGLRARYVNGLVVGEGETHAWVEVYEDGAWMGYDPTRDQCITWGYIKMAHGRDVSDCPTNRGRFYQWTSEQMSVLTQVAQEE